MFPLAAVRRFVVATALLGGVAAFAADSKFAVIEVSSVDPAVSDATADKLEAVIASELKAKNALVNDADLARFRNGVPKPPETDAAASHLATARQQMLNFQFKEALKSLRSARTAIDPAIPQLRDYNLLVDILLQTAIAATYAGDKKAAGVVYTELARLRPDIRVDPRQYPPEVISEFDKVRLAQSNVARGRLVLTSAPEGAKIFVDELEFGVTPATVALFPGDHVLRVSAAGHVDVIERVKVAPYQKTDKRVELAVNEPLAALKELESAVRKGAPPGGLVQSGAKVATALGVSDLVVGVVATSDKRGILSLARLSADGKAFAVVGEYDSANGDLNAAAQPVVDELVSSAPETADADKAIASKVLGDKPKRLLDFDKHLLGVAPGAYSEVIPLAIRDPNFDKSGVVKEPEKPSRWWLWAGAAVLAAAAGGGAYLYASQPAPPPTLVIERR